MVHRMVGLFYFLWDNRRWAGGQIIVDNLPNLYHSIPLVRLSLSDGLLSALCDYACLGGWCFFGSFSRVGKVLAGGFS